MGRFESFTGAAEPQVSEPQVIRAEGDTVTIPDAHLLFTGDFSRSGADLVIAGEGQSVVVSDYFGDAGSPVLVAPNGAVLLPDVVSALAGPLAPGQYAQADDAEPAAGIGSVVSLTGSATAQRSDGTVVELTVDSRLAEGDVVQTASGSALSIVFDDGAVFNLNADCRMVLNELVYEPGGSSNSMLFSMVQGVFAFVAGQVAPTGEMRIDTPAASMGIRGTSGIVKLETIDGVAVFRVIPDPVTNDVGTIVLYSPGTNVILVVMESSDSQWAIDPATGQVIEQPADPGDADIIEQLHQTYIEFAGIVDDPGDSQFAEGGGSGLPTQFSLTSAEIAAIVALAGGALPEIEPLAGEPVGSGLDFGDVPEGAEFDAAPPPPPPPPEPGSSDPQQLPQGGFTGDDFGSVEEDGGPTTGQLVFAGGTGLIEPLVVEGTYGTFEIDADGNWIYTPDNESAAVQSLGEGDSAQETFAVVSADGSETQFVTITVEGVNDVPTVTGTTTGAVAEDGTQVATGAITVDDPDSGESSVQPLSDVAGTYGTFSILADGNWTYTLNDADPAVQGLAEGESVTDSFTVTSLDGTATETVTVTVNGANDQPVAQDDAFTTDENTTVNGDVLAGNGNGPDDDLDGDPLTVTHVNGSTENVGTQIVLASGALLLLSADGSFAYDPNGQFDELGPGDSAQDSFTYTVSDGEGGSDTALVTLTINGANDAPIATNSLIATNQGLGLQGMLTGSDVDSDALTFTLEQGPQNGTVVVNPDGVYDYTPDEGFTGQDSFTYRVADGQGSFDIATVEIDVAEVGEFAAPKEITGTDGNDVLIGSVFDDVLLGGAGSDELFGGDGDDLLDGGAGGDFDHYLDGGAGNDTLITAFGFVYGGAGDDFLDGIFYYEEASGGVIINLSDVDQVVIEQVVQARTAIDEFGDTDTFASSVQSGNTTSFDDVVFGSDVNNVFFLLAGDDVIDAGGGNDAISAGSGNDTIDGGSGIDEVNFSDGGRDAEGDLEMGVVVDLQSGTATDGWGDTDTLTNVEYIVGTHLADTIAGDENANRLDGAGGNDILIGGLGSDELVGGDGADRFEYVSPDEGGDTIEDFIVSEDVLVVDATFFGGDLVAGEPLPDSQFVAGEQPTADGDVGQFLYDTSSGELFWDSDGAGEGGAVHIATLSGAPSLTAADFEIVETEFNIGSFGDIASAVDAGSEPVA